MKQKTKVKTIAEFLDFEARVNPQQARAPDRRGELQL
jgi:hypothetical protein